MDVSLKIAEEETVTLNNLDLAVREFAAGVKKRVPLGKDLEFGLDFDSEEFLVFYSLGDTRNIVAKSKAKYFGQYSIPETPVDPVWWTVSDLKFPRFHPKSYNQCPEWLRTLLSKKITQIDDHMLLSLMLGTFLEMGKFQTAGYIPANGGMLAFGLDKVEWVVPEIPEDEYYAIPEGAQVIEKDHKIGSHRNKKSKK